MDASAHSRGAVLADMTLARYEPPRCDWTESWESPVSTMPDSSPTEVSQGEYVWPFASGQNRG